MSAPATLILAIDTTGARGSVALVSKAGVIEEAELDSPDGFAHVLFGEIEALLARAGVAMGDISAFASAAGPGSFTGVRVGLTAVKGLAEATGRRAVAVSNLQALASFGSGPLRAVAIDARRGEIYGAVYNAALEPVHEEIVTKFEAWLSSLPKRELEFIGIQVTRGAGGDPVAEADVRAPVFDPPRALAGAIGRIALDRLELGLARDPAEIDANYVRRSDAELLWKDPALEKGSQAR
ncbi:MAG TPA: tRNA (adenosine(37)-N6)-threonylcarbamoyltransferase complex dimerization subunit type 1 TsaB [Bryobacteraceae bacterium]|nr:tRNA (adenosine(37)-N6)-threonylcarbamoyltransferase complex dimerization subunit type 1 TsaB [Bryobacteraceae bacterium]